MKDFIQKNGKLVAAILLGVYFLIEVIMFIVNDYFSWQFILDIVALGALVTYLFAFNGKGGFYPIIVVCAVAILTVLEIVAIVNIFSSFKHFEYMSGFNKFTTIISLLFAFVLLFFLVLYTIGSFKSLNFKLGPVDCKLLPYVGFGITVINCILNLINNIIMVSKYDVKFGFFGWFFGLIASVCFWGVIYFFQKTAELNDIQVTSK